MISLRLVQALEGVEKKGTFWRAVTRIINLYIVKGSIYILPRGKVERVRNLTS